MSSRPPKVRPAYDLSDAEKRDLIRLLQEDKPFPEQYRFILFEDKREVELVWNGKSREVSNTILPFQTLEHIDEPRKETKVQENLFDSRGRLTRGRSLLPGGETLIEGADGGPQKSSKLLQSGHGASRRRPGKSIMAV